MFKVNGQVWFLRFVEPNSPMLRRSDGSITLGVTDNKLKTVFINSRLSGRMLDKVLCHEICHTFCFRYGCSFDVQTEEIIADFLATYGREVFAVADDILRRFVIAA